MTKREGEVEAEVKGEEEGEGHSFKVCTHSLNPFALQCTVAPWHNVLNGKACSKV